MDRADPPDSDTDNDKTSTGQKLLASVIIPTYERSAYLREALLSIQQQDFDDERYEIIVIDNGKSGETAGIVAELSRCGSHPARCIREPKLGLHQARHAGARAADGGLLLYIDDDVIAPPHWLATVVKSFEDPGVAVVGGKVLPKWEAEPPDWLSLFHSGYLSLLYTEGRQELTSPDGVWGCNMAVRRSVLFDVGGFNPDAMGDRRRIWERGDGETGLQQKILKAGGKILYEPEAWLYHRIPASRLTTRYFYWRAFIQGISESYTRIRSIAPRHTLSLELLPFAMRCFLTMGRCYASSIRAPDMRIRLRARAWYWYGCGQHQLRVALSQRLRHHVLRDSYL